MTFALGIKLPGGQLVATVLEAIRRTLCWQLNLDGRGGSCSLPLVLRTREQRDDGCGWGEEAENEIGFASCKESIFCL